MIASARHVYVLTDSEKFRHPGAVSFLQLDQVYEIITDEASPRKKNPFWKARISVSQLQTTNSYIFKEVSS